MYKSRWEMIKLAWSVGLREAEEMGLQKDYQNWTPLLVHVYHVGVFAGLGAGVLICVMFSFIFWIFAS